jgi:hypothetical protein
MEINFEPFNYRKELNIQRKLFVECFPENIGTSVETISHYNWKFRSFPFEKNSFEYVAKLDNEIVGYYAAIPYPYMVNNIKVNAAMVCDVMTGIKARGKGVFAKLGVYSTNQFKAEGLAFSTGYPIRPEVIPGHKKAGWEFPFQIPLYGRFIKMNSFLKTRKKAFLITFANSALNIYYAFLSVSKFQMQGFTTELFSSMQLDNITGLNDFFELWKKENTNVLDKSVNFLKWRLGAPKKEYKIVLLKKSKDIVGYTILRKVIKENVPCLGVLDFCVLENYKKASGILFRQMVKEAKTQGAELILMMMMKHQAENYKVKRSGFLSTPYSFSFIIKQFDETLDPNLLMNEKNWQLMWIDSDDL